MASQEDEESKRTKATVAIFCICILFYIGIFGA